MPGSSPLTRGKLMDLDEYAVPWGLIPAHAGKTTTDTTYRPGRRAHPRSRGENKDGAGVTSTPRGSSPLTRGKRPRRHQRRDRLGLIPAHAGKTRQRGLSGRRRRAHPRSRGENAPATTRIARPGGSSPLTRGKQYLRPHRGPRDGLIPAHAGKTAGLEDCFDGARAHPRSRGENW